MTENSNENQPSIMVPLDDLDKVPVDDIDKVDTLVQELATIRQSAKKNCNHWFKKPCNYTPTNY